jgi:hypothetical protein
VHEGQLGMSRQPIAAPRLASGNLVRRKQKHEEDQATAASVWYKLRDEVLEIHSIDFFARIRFKRKYKLIDNSSFRCSCRERETDTERRPLGRSGMGKIRRDGISFSSDLFRSTALNYFQEGISGFSYSPSVGRHHLNRLMLCLSCPASLLSLDLRAVTNHSAGGWAWVGFPSRGLSCSCPIQPPGHARPHSILPSPKRMTSKEPSTFSLCCCCCLLQHRHVDLSDASHKLLL